MPVTYEIDQARALVRTVCTGFVTLDEVMTHFATLENDPRQTGTLDVLLDLRGVTSIPEDVELRKVAARIGPHESTVQYRRCAILASFPGVGIGKLFAAFAHEWFRAITIVDTLEDAENWLRPGLAHY